MARSRKVTVSTDAEGHTAGWAETDLAPVTAPAPDPTAAAFFDVDNTMMQGASIYWFARGLASRNYFTTADLARFAWQQLRFRLLAREHAGDMSLPRRPRWPSSRAGGSTRWSASPKRSSTR